MAKRSILMFDIDKTAYKDFLLFALVDQQAKDGLLDTSHHSAVNSILTAFSSKDIGYEVMVDQVVRTWADGLTGKTFDDVEQHTQDYLKTHADNFRPFVGQVIGLTRDSHSAYFVTAEPQFVAEAVSNMFKADGAICSEFEIEDGKFTGRVKSVLATRGHKLDAILHLFDNHVKSRSMAFGDSEGDVEMLSAVEYAVCVNPSDGLRDIAEANGWFIADTSDEVLDFAKKQLGNSI